jgi:hypothetical protein
MIFAVLSCDRSGNAIDRTAGHIAPIAKPPRAGANRSFFRMAKICERCQISSDWWNRPRLLSGRLQPI